MDTGAIEIAAPSPTSVVRPLVEVEDLCVKFVTREETVRAVNGVSFQLIPGEVLCLIGESGSGKTVTMRALMRLLPRKRAVLAGNVRVGGRDIGGLFDIAKQEFNLQKTRVDFGQTLGIWGISPGPFLVLPFLPPLTVRDGIGTAVDGAMDPLSYVLPFIWTRLGMKVGSMINDRSLNLDLYQGFEETTVDLYSAVRNGYLQRRENMIKSPSPY